MPQEIECRQGEVFTFRIYWLAVLRQIENAKSQSTGSAYDMMAALTFAAFTIEAYVNFSGDILMGSDWKERENFDLKLKRIICRLEMPEINKDAEPYSLIFALKALRDEFAHGKPIKVDETVKSIQPILEACSTRSLFGSEPS